MKRKIHLRRYIALILLGLFFILFFIFTKPFGFDLKDAFFASIFLIFLLGIVYLIAFLLSTKTRIGGAKSWNSLPFLNTFIVFSFLLISFEIYYFKFRTIEDPKIKNLSTMQILTDDTSFVVGTKIAWLDECTNRHLESLIKEPIFLLLKAINVAHSNSDTTFLAEFVCYLKEKDKPNCDFMEIIPIRSLNDRIHFFFFAGRIGF